VYKLKNVCQFWNEISVAYKDSIDILKSCCCISAWTAYPWRLGHQNPAIFGNYLAVDTV